MIKNHNYRKGKELPKKVKDSIKRMIKLNLQEDAIVEVSKITRAQYRNIEAEIIREEFNV